MLKFLALTTFVVAANGYLNHGGAVVGPAPAGYYGNVIAPPAFAHRANFLKIAPTAISPYVKSLPASYQTVEKPQVQVSRPIYTTYNPTVTNLPVNHGAFNVAAPVAGSYAHATYPVAHPAPIIAPASLPGHRYVPLAYGHPSGLSPMPIAPANYGW